MAPFPSPFSAPAGRRRPLRPRAARAFTAVVACAAGWGLSACLLGGGNAKPDTLRILPLAVGNTWVYRDSATFSPGDGGADSVVIDSAMQAITGTRVVTYEGRTETVYLANATRRPGEAPRDIYTYVAHGPEGSHTRGYSAGGAEVLDDVLHVKYPATTGERYPTWYVSLRPGDSAGAAPVRVRDTLEMEVVNADTTCAVPAGTFPCVHYRGWRPGGVLHADAFYAPGIGYLGSIIRRSLSANGREYEVTYIRRLSSYVLK